MAVIHTYSGENDSESKLPQIVWLFEQGTKCPFHCRRRDIVSTEFHRWPLSCTIIFNQEVAPFIFRVIIRALSSSVYPYYPWKLYWNTLHNAVDCPVRNFTCTHVALRNSPRRVLHKVLLVLLKMLPNMVYVLLPSHVGGYVKGNTNHQLSLGCNQIDTLMINNSSGGCLVSSAVNFMT